MERWLARWMPGGVAWRADAGGASDGLINKAGRWLLAQTDGRQEARSVRSSSGWLLQARSEKTTQSGSNSPGITTL